MDQWLNTPELRRAGACIELQTCNYTKPNRFVVSIYHQESYVGLHNNPE